MLGWARELGHACAPHGTGSAPHGHLPEATYPRRRCKDAAPAWTRGEPALLLNARRDDGGQLWHWHAGHNTRTAWPDAREPTIMAVAPRHESAVPRQLHAAFLFSFLLIARRASQAPTCPWPRPRSTLPATRPARHGMALAWHGTGTSNGGTGILRLDLFFFLHDCYNRPVLL